MTAHSERQNLDERLSQLNVDKPDACYYAITLLGENGKIVWGIQTEWYGWADDKQRHELRVPRLVYSKFGEIWTSIHQPFVIVHERDEMVLFLLSGGNALVEQNLFESFMPHFLNPHVSIPDGPYGFAGQKMFDVSAFKRAPTPKLRMKVLNRDNRKCRICGRRPDDDVDVQLHVHHIRPWAKGGVTHPSNLITLCHTCHFGLAPHEDITLFNYVDPTALKPDIQLALEKFRVGVAEYRRIGFASAFDCSNEQDLEFT